MGSPHTLTQADLAADARQLDPNDWQPSHVSAHLADQHPQVRAWPNDNPYAAHDHDHHQWTPDHSHPSLQRAQDFARLNPRFGPLLRPGDPYRQRLVQAWELELAVGQRVERAIDQENLGTPAARTTAVLDRAHNTPERAAERAFDRLNPQFGVPADTHDPLGQQAVRDREAALALGPRVAVAGSRENDRDPVIWLGGQDYRAADAIHAARAHPIRTRQGPERVGAER